MIRHNMIMVKLHQINHIIIKVNIEKRHDIKHTTRRSVYNTAHNLIWSFFQNSTLLCKRSINQSINKPIAVHCWAWFTSNVRHDIRFFAFRILSTPAALFMSSDHLTAGHLTLRLPSRGLHSRTFLLQRPSVFRHTRPVHCHFSVLIHASVNKVELPALYVWRANPFFEVGDVEPDVLFFE